MAIRPIDALELRKRMCALCNQDYADEPCDPSDCIFIRALNGSPTLTRPPVTGNTSDGYHTFNEIYHHRAVLFSVICNEHPDIAWKSKRHHDGTMYDGMFIVGIDTPAGPATYHYDVDPYWDKFHVKEMETAPEWDGHTSDEAIRRIGTLTQPNEPLTLDELRKMDGQPVWWDYGDFSCWGIVTVDDAGRWKGVPFFRGRRNHNDFDYDIDDRNMTIYRRPPKGEEKI